MLARVKTPEASTVTEATTAGVLPPVGPATAGPDAMEVVVTGEPVEAAAGVDTSASKVTVAPSGLEPTTVPLSVAGTPPSRTLTSVTFWPAFNCTGVALSGVRALGYHNWVNPAPLNRIL